MKSNLRTNLRPTLALAGLGWIAAGQALVAAPFLYTPGDLVLAFRQLGNASDYVVNIGRAAAFSSAAPGSVIAITPLSTTQLNSAFPSLNALKWSVAAANRPPLDPTFPPQTLWVTSPRGDRDTVAVPWQRKGQFIQGNIGSQIDGIGVNAALSSSLLPGGPDNTATGVVIPTSAPYAVGPVLGDPANYAGQFQGNVEAVTADDFATDPTLTSRADLYELLPGTSAAGTLNQPGRHVGTFEFRNDGTLVFTAASPSVAAPRITQISRQGDVTTVAFTTVAGATYRLRSTDAAGLTSPVSQWATGSTVAGDGGTKSLQENGVGDLRFFAIEVNP
ncbi:MAG: hypothetical protein IT581_02500 [Verrucomicrobiales bacterium]|nr:hypothetical protein [Verrucomicrobiales bacterium]